MKIGILNAYDARNRGDLAIVLCQIEALKRRFKDAEFLVFSHHAAANRGVLEATSVESIIHLPPGASAVVRLLHPLWDMARWLARSRAEKFRGFRECDLYAVCGGGYLYSSRAPLLSRNLACLCLEILLAARTGKPVIQFPQSFGPITKAADRWFVERVCRALPRLTPRCEHSVALLKDWGWASKAEFMPDIALLMRKLLPSLYQPCGPRNGLGVAPANYGFAQSLSDRDRHQYVGKLAAVCEHFHRLTGEPVLLMTQVSVEAADDDALMVEALAGLLEGMRVPHLRMPRTAGLKEYVSRIAELRAFIGTRMHACIFAFTARVPALGLAYQPKFETVYHLLDLRDWVKPVEAWTTEWACDRIGTAINAGDGLRNELDAKMTRLEAQLEQRLEQLLGPGKAAG
jgi:polysaccharide pyruvyl transferase WcaK-like protein